MKVEIERKFLLASEGWRREVHHSEYIRDGLVAISDGRKTRVRIIGERATLTVKTNRIAGSRFEFEYDIPLEDAELMLASCGTNATAKRRHYVLHGGLTWEIDEYEGILKRRPACRSGTGCHRPTDRHTELDWFGGHCAGALPQDQHAAGAPEGFEQPSLRGMS